MIRFIITKLKLEEFSCRQDVTGRSEDSNGRYSDMNRTIQRSVDRSAVARLTALGVLLCFPAISSAQNLNAASRSAGQPIPTEVAVEYATIGSVSLPFRILGINGGAPGVGGQGASNLQVGNRNQTDINQLGRGNAAAIRILGDDNTAAIAQQGTGNAGQGTLTGTGIRFDLQQNGVGNQADLSVNAPAGANLQVRQDGNSNTATGSVPGTANVVVNQVGNGLSVDVSQAGVAKSINVLQVRAR